MTEHVVAQPHGSMYLNHINGYLYKNNQQEIIFKLNSVYSLIIRPLESAFSRLIMLVKFSAGHEILIRRPPLSNQRRCPQKVLLFLKHSAELNTTMSQ